MKFFLFSLWYLPIFLYIFFYSLKNKIFQNFYSIQFFVFYCLIVVYLFFFLFCKFFRFFYKNYRYSRYYYSSFRSSKSFFNKLSVYFSFWHYLFMYIWKNIYSFFIFYIKNIIISIKKYINFSLISIFYSYIYVWVNILSKLTFFFALLYKKFIIFFSLIYKIFQINEFYFFSRKIFTKYKEDPFLNRNNYIKFPIIWFNLYPFLGLIKSKFYEIYYFSIDFFFLFLFYLCNLVLFFMPFKLRFYYCIYYLYQKIFIQFIINFIFYIKFFYNCLKIFLFYFFYFIILSIIYCFNFIFYFILKIKNLILFFILFYICLKYFWIINYYFYILYQHYCLYFPLLISKPIIRSFDFIWIDFRNYINLIFLHNSLVDISYFNNEIYNNLLINLNLSLKNYGLKFREILGLSTMNLRGIWKIYNNDTFLLDNIFQGYNKYRCKFKYWSYKRLLELYNEKLTYNYSLSRYLKILYKRSGKDGWILPRKRRIASMMEESLSLAKDSSFFENDKLDVLYPLSNDMKVRLTFYIRYYINFLRKRMSSVRIRFRISPVARLNHVPLHYIILSSKYNNWEYYHNLWAYTDLILEDFEKHKYLWLVHLLRKLYKFGVSNLYNYNTDNNVKLYFFKIYYFFNTNFVETIEPKTKSSIDNIFKWSLIGLNKLYSNYSNLSSVVNWNDSLFLKYNIPTYNWTEAKYKRVWSSYLDLDPMGLISVDEDYSHEFYEDYSYIHMAYRWKYRYKYIYINYPYKLYNKFADSKFLISSLKKYQYTFSTFSKILKKYFFFKYQRVSSCNSYYLRILDDFITYTTVIFTKLQAWHSPFFFKLFNLRDFKNGDLIKYLNFWDFFYYSHCNKYYTVKYPSFYKNKIYINLKFIQRFRKDLYHIRQLFLRFISVFLYSKSYTWANVEIISPEYQESTDTESDSEQSINLKNFFLFDNWEEPFDKYHGLLYQFDLFLTTDQTIEVYSTSLLFHLKMFIYNYSHYFKYPIFFNNYNFLYKRKVDLYKLRALNKINNLKRFLFLKNKKLSGFSIFNYIKCFFLQYHINHLLWHSPYSFILFNKNNIQSCSNFLKKLYLSYYYNNNFIIFINYSYLFNLLFNYFDINNNLAYELTYNVNNIIILNNYYYYNYGHHNYLNLNSLDCYRIFISLFFKYYNNFLEKLSRYSYILKLKDYKITTFIWKYFNFKNWFKHFYIRFRLQIYRFRFWGEWIKRGKFAIFKPKNHYTWRSRKMDFIPLWLIFENYIKLFIYYLLHYYYSKLNFICWWLSYRIKFYMLFFFYVKILEIFFIYKIYFKLNIDINFRYNLFSFFFIEIKLFFFFFFNIFFKLYLLLGNFTLIINFKFLIYYKLVFEKLFNYFNSLCFRFKNKNLIFKPNYYYYRIHKGEKLTKKLYYWKYNRKIMVSSFKTMKLRHSLNSFRHYTKNFYFFKNLYRFNFMNYFYLYNEFNIIGNTNMFFFSIYFPLISVKYKFFNLTILWFIIYFIVLFFFYYYKITFINIWKKANKKQFYSYFTNLNMYFKKYINFKWLNFSKLSYKNYNYYYQIGEFEDSIEKDRLTYLKNPFSNFYLYFKVSNKNYNFYSHYIFNKENLNFWFIYFFIIIPVFFFDYILWKLHLRGHTMKKRRFFFSLRLLFDNFKFMIKLYRCLGTRVVYSKRKSKLPRNYYNYIIIRRKKHLRRGYFFRLDRFRHLYCHLSAMGSYYYWFAHIEKMKYFIFYIKFYFYSIYNSYYYWICAVFYIFFFSFSYYLKRLKNILRVKYFLYNKNIFKEK